MTPTGLSYDIWDVSGNFGISRDKRTGERAQWCGRHDSSLLLLVGASDETAELLEVVGIETLKH